MGTFALSVAAFAEKAKERADQCVRAIAVNLLSTVIEMSPVGNPELWAANADAVARRESHNYKVNVAASFTLKPGQKVPRALKQKSARSLAKLYPLTAGKGYVGGRFKGNWQVTVGTPATGQLDRIDPGGGETRAEGEAALDGFTAGVPIFITNTLPYAVRLEYGWSRQAPAGMVRVTIATFPSMVSEAVNSLPQ